MKRTLKKTMSILLAFTLLFGTFAFGFSNVDLVDFAVKAEATETFTEGFYTYSVDENGNATIIVVDEAIMGDIEIPSSLGGYSVKSIGEKAFRYCEDITSVTIPNSITIIKYGAFEYCDSLSKIVIPKSVVSIERGAFSWCDSLTNITVDSANLAYSSDDFGVLFNKEKTELIQYPIGNKKENYQIPDTVIDIKERAFIGCPWLKSVTISNGVKTIGADAFYNNYNLSSITIPKSVISIDEEAFMYCEALTAIDIPGNTTNIGEEAFKFCDSLSSITVDSDNTIYSSDNGVLFNKNKTELIQYPIGNTRTSYQIPNTVTQICKEAFLCGDNLTYINIPDSVVNIKSDAFKNTGYYNNEANWEDGVLYIGNFLIKVNTNVHDLVVIKNGTKVIADSSFFGCNKITNISIPETVTNIGAGAFAHCTGFTDITIPDSITSLGDSSTFYGCTGLKRISISNNVRSIGYCAFACCTSLSEISIPNSVISIDVQAFSECDNLRSITIPDSVKKIGSYVFSDTAYYNDESNWENGVLYIGNHLIEANSDIASVYEIKSETKTIAEGAFNNIDSLTSVIIPNSITNISKNAFAVCCYLSSIYIPNSVTSIDKSAFYYCLCLSDVFFSGNEEEWNKILVGDKNESLVNATIHYNYIFSDVPKDPTIKPSDDNFMKKPSRSIINYGDTMILHLDFTNIPADAKIEWSVDGNGVSIKPSADGKTCAVTSVATGGATITAKYVDSNGVEHVSEQEIESNASFWQKIVSFFKNLFGINRIIEQRIKF